MLTVSETEAAAIRTTWEQEGELTAAIEFRKLFPGITDVVRARECVRMIAGWTPRAPSPSTVLKFLQAKTG